MICTHLLQCTNINGQCIPFIIIVSQTISGTINLTHVQTSPMPLDLPYNTKYSLRTWLRKTHIYSFENITEK